jgi:type II secretory pathway component PulK
MNLRTSKKICRQAGAGKLREPACWKHALRSAGILPAGSRGIPAASRGTERGSVLVIVLLISIGLISLALYFANSMTMELRASDNRTSGVAADQAIEGGARYVLSILTTYATNGAMPDPSVYESQAVPVGDSNVQEENAHFWLIGRDVNGDNKSANDPVFGLVDESSKLDLNAPWLNADILSTNLPNMTSDFADAIIDWRTTNGTSDSSLNYSQNGYLAKHAPFESVGELRLVYSSTMDILAGDDINRNGILDANEQDSNGNGEADAGALDYFTVYSRAPNTHSDGTSLTNVNIRADIEALLTARLGASRAQEILGVPGQNAGFGQQAANNPGQGAAQYSSVLDFYIQHQNQMTADDFAMIYNDITATNSTDFVVGRVNVNTASAAVLACVPGLTPDLAQQLVSFRASNPTKLTSVAWVVEALGQNNTAALNTLSRRDYLTTHTYQFAADIAALGPFGRGYRRVRFVFDVSDGTPKIIYRQDLSRLGWALGKQARETWVAQNTR